MAVAGNVSHVAIAQGAAATTELVAAPGAGYRIVVHGATVAQAAGGTLKFQSAATDLTGAMSTHANNHSPVDLFAHSDCVLRCAANEALNLTSATNPVTGVVFYSIESTS